MPVAPYQSADVDCPAAWETEHQNSDQTFSGQLLIP